MKKFILVVTLVFAAAIAKAQQDFELAMKYYNAKEYEKAEVLFDKLYKERHATYYFEYYVDCLDFQGEYKAAERRIKKEIRKHPKRLSFYVELGYIQKKAGDDADADKSFKKAYRDLPADINTISEVGNAFFRRKEYEWAERVFEKGEKDFPGQFQLSLVAVYSYERKFDKMIDAYIDFLHKNPARLAFVESNFRAYLKNDVNNEFADLLEKELIMAIQKNRDDEAYELLVWFYSEKTKFGKALVFAEALDRRNNENGVRVFRIGQKAMANKDYDVAEEAFEYVIDKGAFYPYYLKSRFALLKVMYDRVVAGEYSSDEQISKVEKSYLDMINELGVSGKTIDLIVDLAHLEAFYLDKTDKAIDLLNQGLNIGGLRSDMKAKIMMELGDVYVISGKPWDAILIYARVEKSYPNMQISDEAKFKKAMAYFYVGMIEFAKQQWDVLKGSPAKLIANDAIYWSTFIIDNKVDSSYSALKKYAAAELLLKEKKYDDALKTCDTIITKYAGNEIVAAAYNLKYRVYYDKKDYEQAAEILQKQINSYPYAMWNDKAIYDLAVLYDDKLSEPDKAKKLYTELLFNYQASVYSDKARERMKKYENSL